MLTKGIILLLVFVLFVSRLIPKFIYFFESNQVNLFGHTLTGMVGLFSLVLIAILAIVLFVLGVKNVAQFFFGKKSSASN